MTAPADALARWLRYVAALPGESVALADAVWRVCASDVRSLRDSPPAAVAAMDGIAVRAATTAGLRLAAGAYDVVDTGDLLPPGRDAVVVREQVSYEDGSAVLTHAAVAGRHVRPRGEYLAAGDLLLPAGRRLRPVDVALAAAGGLVAVPVRRRPRVVVVPTGDEVVAPGTPAGPGQVLDTNSLMLVALCTGAGAHAWSVDVVADDPTLLATAVQAACATADLVVVGAGSSAGRDDHTATVLASLGELLVHGVAVRPGHPVALAVVAGTPVLGSPGYPVAAALAFDLFTAPLLAALLGTTPPARPRTTARLSVDLDSPAGVEDWVRVRLDGAGATPLPGGAGRLASLAAADGLLRIPAASTAVPAGTLVEIALLHGT